MSRTTRCASLLLSLALMVALSACGAKVAADQTVAVSLQEWSITPKEIAVKLGTTVELDVKNDGTQPHNLTVDGYKGTGLLTPGNSEKLTFKADKAGTFTTYCDVAGHKESGMVGVLMVK